MNIIGKVTAIGDIKTFEPREGSQFTTPLNVRTIEVKWFTPRSAQGGTRAGVTGAGLELRNNLATDCRLQVNDWITAEVDIYPSQYTDSEGKIVCNSRLIVNRYALINDFNELK